MELVLKAANSQVNTFKPASLAMFYAGLANMKYSSSDKKWYTPFNAQVRVIILSGDMSS